MHAKTKIQVVWSVVQISVGMHVFEVHHAHATDLFKLQIQNNLYVFVNCIV